MTPYPPEADKSLQQGKLVIAVQSLRASPCHGGESSTHPGVRKQNTLHSRLSCSVEE